MGIRYRCIDNFKFQLKDTYSIQTEIRLTNDISTPDMPVFIQLTGDGMLTINAGYAWDGASGPSINNKTIIRGSLVHDALYQLMRAGVLLRSYKRYADELFRDICIEDGMFKFRAWYVFHAVDKFAKFATKPGTGQESKIYTAP